MFWAVTTVMFFPMVHYEELFRKARLQLQPHLRQSTRRALLLGCFMIVLSVAFGLELIRRLVWSSWAWHEALSNVSAVFVLCWAGLVLTWKALGQHETIVLPFGDADERPSAFKLELNFATFLFAFPVAHWLSLLVGKALAAWGAFQSPQGFLANGTYVFPPAMTAAYQAELAKLFVIIANTIAMALPFGIAAWRSERGGSLRVFAPLGIGFIISFVFVFFSLIPTPLAAAALLQGLLLGLVFVAALRMRKVPVPRGESANRDWKLKVNEKATWRVLPWAVLGLAIIAVGSARAGWMQWTQTFAFGLACSALAVLAGGWQQKFARQRGLFPGLVFFAFFSSMGGAVEFPDVKAVTNALPRLVPAILAAYFLYRAASKPLPPA